MKKWLGWLSIWVAGLTLLSCSSGQQLLSITITPSSQTFGAPDTSLNVQLRALGTYSHPPATKDLTTQVTWASNTPQVVVVNSTGLLSPAGIGCGNAVVSATLKTNDPIGNVVVGNMTATVDNVNVSSCPQP
jgi:Bacterial Ig-like domain (group 2)